MIVVCQIIATDELDIINKLYTPYLKSKSIRVVKQNESMTTTIKKLEKVQTNL